MRDPLCTKEGRRDGFLGPRLVRIAFAGIVLASLIPSCDRAPASAPSGEERSEGRAAPAPAPHTGSSEAGVQPPSAREARSGARAPSPAPPDWGEIHEAIRRRTTRELDEGFVLKPARAAGTEASRALDLAPLLLVEKKGSLDALPLDFGRIERTPDGDLQVVPDAPRIYTFETSATVRGDVRRRLHFVWFKRPHVDSSEHAEDEDKDPGSRGFVRNELRVTLDEEGYPWIQEVLGDASGAVAIYVTTETESRALEAFGSPLPGRTHAVEPAVDEIPEVVVPRVLARGPVPMGPWIYIESDRLDVTTLLCRCMASQVRGALETSEYVLEVVGDDDIAELSTFSPDAADHPDETLREALSAEGWLDRAIRLPPPGSAASG